MNILEKEIEELLFFAISEYPALVIDKGLPLLNYGNYYRQMDLGSYGRADIVGIHFSDKVRGKRLVKIHVIELKKEKIDFGSLNQAIGYATGLRQMIQNKLTGSLFQINISLIGKSIDLAGSFPFVPGIANNIKNYTYELDFFEGLKFIEQKGFQMTNPGFSKNDIFSDQLERLSIGRFMLKTTIEAEQEGNGMEPDYAEVEDVDDLDF